MEDMAETDVVTVGGLRKTYGNRVVVDRLDLDVPAGETVRLAGADGAGKTTTVECIQGLGRPDAGLRGNRGDEPRRPGPLLEPLLFVRTQNATSRGAS
jgi:ABC-2 type transport system ATP-binding protein